MTLLILLDFSVALDINYFGLHNQGSTWGPCFIVIRLS